MNRTAIAAIAGIVLATAALVWAFIAAGSAADTSAPEDPIISTAAPTDSVQAPPRPAPGEPLPEDPDGPQDDSVDDIMDTTAAEATAAAAASAWLTVDSAEDSAARAARLTAVGLAADVAAPSIASPDDVTRVGLTADVDVTSVDLVALASYDEATWTISVFAAVEALYAQPGTAQTRLDRIEVLVDIDRADATRIVSISER